MRSGEIGGRTGCRIADAVEAHDDPDILKYKPVAYSARGAKESRYRLAFHLVSARLASHTDRRLVGEPRRGRPFLQRDCDAGIQFLPDAGHGEEDVWRHLAQVLRHRIRCLGEVDDVHRSDVIVAAAKTFSDMAQG